jgi:hypothetical protein
MNKDLKFYHKPLYSLTDRLRNGAKVLSRTRNNKHIAELLEEAAYAIDELEYEAKEKGYE